MFSAGVPVSYPHDNSNNSFLESENCIAMTGVPPEYDSYEDKDILDRLLATVGTVTIST